MFVELIVMLVVGLVAVCIGVLIWKKEQISLIHPYHYEKVKIGDRKAYTTLMGKGVFVIGVGSVLSGVLNYSLKTQKGWFIFVICMAIGLFRIVKAQRTYNGGLF